MESVTIGNFMLYTIGVFAVFVLAIYITRAIFSIPKIIKQNDTQIKLLALIAEKLSAEDYKIKDIMDDYKKPSSMM